MRQETLQVNSIFFAKLYRERMILGMNRKLIKGFLSVMLMLLIVELPAMCFHMGKNLKAADGTRNSSLNQYDQVKIGGSEYTYLGDNKYLLNDTLGTQSWAAASAAAASYKDTGSFGNKEKRFINSSSLASKADIGAGNDNTAISASIPNLSGNWWLSDIADQSYTRAYVNATNILNAGREEQYNSRDGSVCKISEIHTTGGLPSEDYDLNGEQYVGPTIYHKVEVEARSNNFSYRNPSNGSCRTVRLEIGERVYMWAPNIPAIGSDMSKNWYMDSKGAFSMQPNCWSSEASGIVTANIDETKEMDGGVSCPPTTHKAETAAARPMIELNSSIFSMFSSKDIATGSILENYPDTGSDPYNLQVIDNTLAVGLDTDNATVNGNNTIEIALDDISDNGDIMVPYDTRGSIYEGGKSFISAMTDDDHYKKLSSAVENGKGSAILNLNNIATFENGKIIPQTINVNLYQEEITAEGHMDYISAPLPVSIVIQHKQSLEQMAGDVSETFYGTPIELHFNAKGSDENPTSVSNKPITFTLSTEDQAYADLADKGNGVVEVKPLKAGKTINIMVDKAGDTNHLDAPQLSVPLELKKKGITITAESYTKDIGEDEPSYEINAGDNDLVNGDSIPPGIKAVTTYIATDGKLMSETTGTDITIDEDDSADVVAFKEKYDITYVKGKLIVGKTTADETWLDVSPTPVVNGWNTTNVIIKPSTLAISKGYTKIAMNGGVQETQITIDSSTLKENMEFILYKDNGSMTSEIILSNDIKIDKDAPVTAITSIENEDVWTTQKKVEFTVTETGSGINAIRVTKPDGSEASVTTVLTGSTFSFIADQAGTYTIDVDDHAGNTAVQSSKTINKIDLTDLNIKDISNDGFAVDDPWESVERIVTFKIVVGDSGLKTGMPQVTMGSDDLTVTYNGNGNYSFTATKNGTYKIIAESNAGDKKEVTGTISKIDKTAPVVTIDVEKIPETFSMRLLNALTGGAFYKGGFIVTVRATDDESGIDTITSPNGTGTITTNGTTKTLTYTVSENFKGLISAEAVNMAGLDTTEATQIIVNENSNQTITIQPTGVSGHINADDVFEAKLSADVSANQSGLKEISYIAGEAETSLQTYTSNDAEAGSLILNDNIVIPLTTIIQNAPADQDELVVTIKVTTNSGNTLTRDVTVQYDINAATISIISVEKEDDWAYQKQVDFSVNEEGSGIDSITVRKPDGTQATVNGELTGTVFDFIADQSGLYTIDVDDKAGNKALQISKNITKIDRNIPAITDVAITPDNDTWAEKKTVSFHVKDLVDADSGSGVDQDSIKVTNASGTEETLTCTGNKDDMICSFEVTKEDTYTINAKDLAGNVAVSKEAVAAKIDTSHVDITDVSNDGSGVDDQWLNTGRVVTFKVTAGQSGLKSGMPQVMMDAESLTVTDNGNGNYSFTAPENGAYKIIAENELGDKKEVTGTISKIDKTAPTVSDLKLEQESDLTQHDPRVNVSFKAADNESGIVKVSYIANGTEILLTSQNDTYSFMTSENGTYSITIVDEAGNSETIAAEVSIPKINAEPADVSVYEKDVLSLSIKADMNDTLQTGRTYAWFYIDGEGNETSIKTGTLTSENNEQTIPFPYSEAKAEHSGNYRCMIKNGDGFYTWSSMFKLTVISDPVTGLVMIPSEIEMKNMDDGSETAQAVFDIELSTTAEGTVPTSKFYIETVKELLLKDTGSENSYKAKVYKETGGSYLPYESGSIAELEYSGIKKQKVKLMMPVKEYHDQGTYQGLVRFIIRYGEGGTGE